MATKKRVTKKRATKKRAAPKANGLKKFQSYLKAKTVSTRKRVKAAEVKLNQAKRVLASARKKAIAGFKKRK